MANSRLGGVARRVITLYPHVGDDSRTDIFSLVRSTDVMFFMLWNILWFFLVYRPSSFGFSIFSLNLVFGLDYKSTTICYVAIYIPFNFILMKATT